MVGRWCVVALACFWTGVGLGAEEVAGKPGEHDHLYQLKERRVEVLPGGLSRVRVHNIVKVLNESAVDEVGTVSIGYNGHYASANLISAFTLTAAGERREIDRKVVQDRASGDADGLMYTDARLLTFSLPAVQVGATVEYEVEIAGKEPVIPQQAWDQCTVREGVPVELFRYELKTPAGMTFAVDEQGPRVSMSEHSGEGVLTRVWEARNLPAVEFEAGMPTWPEVAGEISVSSLPDWPSLKTWFTGLAAGKEVIDPELAAAAKQVVGQSSDPGETLCRLYRFVHREVRYVGIELGQGAYEPRPAVSCYRQRYGDCKDQAVLLTGLLRQAGLEADLVLVRPAGLGPVAQKTPSPAQFNHVIVGVKLPEGTRWVDPTIRYMAEPLLPPSLEGAAALPLAGDGTLITLRQTAPERHLQRSVYDIEIDPFGKAVITDTDECHGGAGIWTRESYLHTKESERRQHLEEYIEGKGRSPKLLDFGNDDPAQQPEPFRVWLRYETRDILARNETGFVLSVAAAEDQTGSLVSVGGIAASAFTKPRVHDWMRQSGAIRETVYRVHLPRGFRLAGEHKPILREWPHGRCSLCTEQKDGVVEVRLRAESRPTRIPAARWQAESAEVEQGLGEIASQFVLEDEIEILVREQHPAEALRRLSAWAAEQPKDAVLQRRLGRLLLQCGMLDSARRALRVALELAPTDPAARADLAKAYGLPPEGDDTGVWTAFEREPLVAVMQEGVTAATTPAAKTEARLALARVYECNERGEYMDADAPFAKALAIYEDLLKESPEDDRVLRAQGECLIALGRYKDAEAAFRKAMARKGESIELQGSIWITAALAGRVEEAIATLQGKFEKDGQAAQLSVLKVFLLRYGAYAQAAQVEERLQAVHNQGARGQKLPVLLRRMAASPGMELKGYRDLSTPRGALVSMVAAVMNGDAASLRRIYSERTQIGEKEIKGAMLLGRLAFKAQGGLKRFTWDLMSREGRDTVRELPGGDLEVSLQMPAELGNDDTTGRILVTSERGEYRVLADFSSARGALQLGNVIASHLDEGRIEAATRYTELAIAELQGPGTRGREPGEGSRMTLELADQNFPDAETRCQAVAGALLLALSKEERGLARLRPAQKKMPENQLLARICAEALLETKRADEAVALLSDVEIAKNIDRKGRQQLLQALIETHRYADAEKLLTQLLGPYGGDVGLRMLRLQLLTESGRHELALKEIAELGGRLPRQALIAMEATQQAALGREKELRGLLEKTALLGREKALPQREAFVDAFLILGSAEDALEQAVCLFLGGEKKNLARMLALAGRREDAYRLLNNQELRAEAFDDARDRVKALLCLVSLRTEEARERLTAAGNLGFSPERERYRLMLLGVAEVEAGRAPAARTAFAAALAADREERWPAPLAKLLLGQKSLAEVVTEAQNCTSPLLRIDRLCEVHCYGGYVAWQKGAKAAAAAEWKAALATKSLMSDEWLLASWALDAHGGGAPR